MKRKAEIFGGIGAIVSFAVLLWISINMPQDVVANEDHINKASLAKSFQEIWVYNRFLLDRIEVLEKKMNVKPPDNEFINRFKEHYKLEKTSK